MVSGISLTSNTANCAEQIPVLLIRGLTREQRHWGDFRLQLAAQLPNPVLSYDFAGCGELYQQASPCKVSALRQSIRQQLQRSSAFHGKVHLVAISLGGMLASDWASVYPHEVASMLLINSSAKPLSPFYKRLNWRNYPALLMAMLASTANREKLILQLTTASPQPPQVLHNWQQWQQQRPVSAKNALRQLWAASRFTVAAAPRCKTLLISSAGDRLVSPDCTAALAEHWQVKHIRHAWGGHDLPLDDSHWLSAQIQQFIADEQLHR